jgi:hypothetical protein
MTPRSSRHAEVRDMVRGEAVDARLDGISWQASREW